MKKKVLILDLDGTLYYQIYVKLFMVFNILGYYIFHFWRMKDIFIILSYRKYRENNENTSTKEQYKFIADKYKVASSLVEEVINKWMFKKPLNLINRFKDKKLINIISTFKDKGGKVIIYSDYPTDDKLKAMGISYDKSYSPINNNIKYLKPNPKGLDYIIKENKFKREDILYVGDRDSKDGECARKCSVDYIILPKFNRNKYYMLIKDKINF